ncbi:MAG: hypothetical protein ABSB30_05595 [Terracidiphilus sp.]|jgi:hypothetical protein
MTPRVSINIYPGKKDSIKSRLRDFYVAFPDMRHSTLRPNVEQSPVLTQNNAHYVADLEGAEPLTGVNQAGSQNVE